MTRLEYLDRYNEEPEEPGLGIERHCLHEVNAFGKFCWGLVDDDSLEPYCWYHQRQEDEDGEEAGS